jgi:ribosome-associated protein
MSALLPGLHVPFHELEFSFARSSGPGGQNVNKVNTKAVLRWRPAESTSLPEHARERILARLAPKLTVEGDLVIASDRFRDQKRNKEDCIEKLVAILAQASAIPKARRKTKPSRSAKRKRRESKSRDSEKKKLRGRVVA